MTSNNKIIHQTSTAESGINTKFWGPSAWIFLFSSCLTYPIKIDDKNPLHRQIKTNYKNLFMSLKYTLPCCFCLDSYRRFIKNDPIENSLNSRLDLLLWLYNLRDKVNKKLMAQEKEQYDFYKTALQKKYKSNLISKDTFDKRIQCLKKKYLRTEKSPPFKEILKDYEHYRA